MKLRIEKLLCWFGYHAYRTIETAGHSEVVICERDHCRRMWVVNGTYGTVECVKR
jgi:hypothetical protein